MEDETSAACVCVCMPTLSLHHVQYVAVCIVDALTVLGDSLLEYI